MNEGNIREDPLVIEALEEDARQSEKMMYQYWLAAQIGIATYRKKNED